MRLFWSKVRLIIWKNFIIRRRSLFRNIVEILWPLTIFLILLVTRIANPEVFEPSDVKGNVYFFPRALPSAGMLPFIQSLFCHYNTYKVFNKPQKIPSFTHSNLYKLVQNIEPIITNASVLQKIQEALQSDQKLHMLYANITLAYNNILNDFTNDEVVKLFLSSLQRNEKIDLHSQLENYTINALLQSKVKIKELGLQYFNWNKDENREKESKTFFCSIANLLIFPSSLNKSMITSDICKNYKQLSNTIQLLKKNNSFIAALMNLSFVQDIETTILKLSYEINQEFFHFQGIYSRFLHEYEKIFNPAIEFVNNWHDNLYLKSLMCNEKYTTSSEEEKILYKEPHMKPLGRDYDKSVCKVKLKSFIESLKVTNGNTAIVEFLISLLNGKILYTPNNQKTKLVIQRISSIFSYFALKPNIKDLFKTILKVAKEISPIEHKILRENDFKSFMENLLRNKFLYNLTNQKQFESLSNEILNASKSSETFKSKIKIFSSNLQLAVEYYENLENIFDCYNLSNYFVSFENEEELVKYSSKSSNIFPSIVFLNLFDGEVFPKKVEYKLRFNPTFTPSTLKVKSNYWIPGPNPIRPNRFLQYEYISNGFVFLQDIIDRVLTELITNKTITQPGIYAQQFPYPRYIIDSFYDLAMTMPLCITLSWLYTFSMIVKSIVHEKESKLKEVMKVMGLTDSIHWTAWFITTLICITFSAFALTFLLKFGRILSHSDVSLIIFITMIYAISIISMAFFVSIFFSKTNMAAACGGLFYFFTFTPFVFCGYMSVGDTSFIKLGLMSLFPTSAFALGFKYIFIQEDQSIGAQWSNYYSSPFLNDTFNIGWVVNFMVFDFFLYSTLTIYFLQVLPGEGGKPWYFCFTKSFWYHNYTEINKKPFALKGYVKIKNLPDTNLDCLENEVFKVNPKTSENFEVEPYELNVGIDIVDLVKIYQPLNKCAVNNVSLKIYENQVSVLLGHNGAGKSSIMSILTGVLQPTSGTAFINNTNICTNIKKALKGLGWCPQNNVLFDKLTVEEHILFYGELKGLAKQKICSEAERFLTDVGLEKKRNELSCNLSGGMKRKLSIALAFIGKSKVIILDEPTSGVDPFARRGIWDLILKYKAGRTILLSTHYMDEADALGDRISILSNGKVKCSGSSLFLKQHFTKGYRLTILLDDSKNNLQSSNELLNFVSSFVNGATLEKVSNFELTFSLPSEAKSSGGFENLFIHLEESKNLLGIQSYGLADSSIEEVFLNACYDESLKPEKTTASSDVMEPFKMSDDKHSFLNRHAKSSKHQFIKKHQIKCALWIKQYQALLTKRFYHSTRNVKGAISEILLPTIFVVVAICITLIQPWDSFKPSLKLSTEMFSKPNYIVIDTKNSNRYFDSIIKSFVEYPGQDGNNSYFVNFTSNQYGISSSITKNNRVIKSATSTYCTDTERKCDNLTFLNIGTGDTIVNITGYSMNDYLISTMPKFINHRFGGLSFEEIKDYPCSSLLNITCENIFHIPQNIIKVWYNLKGYHALPVYLNSINNAILRANIPASDDPSQYGIITYNHPINLKIFSNQEILSKSIITLLVPLFVIVATSFVPASFLVYLVEDRASKFKHLQIINGLNPVIYWIANFTWDMISFLLPVVCALAVFFIFDQKAYISSQNLPATLLLFILYGWSIIPMMYPMSFVFNVPSNAYIVMIIANLFIGVIGTIATFIFDIIDTEITLIINQYFKNILLIFPNYCLGRGIMDLGINENTAELEKSFGINSFRDPFSWDITGRNLIAMSITGVIYLMFTLLCQFNFFTKPWTYNVKIDSLRSDINDDVMKEEMRVTKEGSLGKCFALRTSHLSKIYKGRKNLKTLAVNQISFGVEHGECFGLLGVNGAGKSSTFNMLTGDTPITDGDAFVDNYSIRNNLADVYHTIGYCPQTDAFDELLTAKELFIYFSRLRGFNKSQSKKIANWALNKLGLFEYKNQKCCEYSGGNKRKVSTGLALIGSPSLIFLDEPTTGMDPGSRRFLWDVIISLINNGKSVVLTSHSMEECETLCSRIAIMVNGEFKCLGTPQHLKNKYGLEYIILIRCSSHLFVDVEDFMKSNLLDAKLKFCRHNVMEYCYPSCGINLSQLFNKLELLKKTLFIDEYSLSQSTLDQVFVNFARSQVELTDYDKKVFSVSLNINDDDDDFQNGVINEKSSFLV
ncbi:ATP-binding cassette sub-family A member 2 isoform X1 [Hydra vulgaris]|uniref:ATP-binding cassette sub-family A member 2 isoform X1 n=1 Tax=Hydra vulgaris TaxID=6087 RepID=UPI001F5F6565|nr:ATP-binding cassette sub-family A member 2-like [Hydra vulgaris]